MNYDQALKFLTSIYPEKVWQFRSMENNAFFFDTVIVNEEKEEYEQIYIVNKKNKWEILLNHETQYSSPYKQPYDLANDLDNFNNNKVGVKNSVGFDQYTYRYYGSKSPKYTNQFTNKEQHFLQIVKDGLDISLPKGSRSTYELSNYIDFDKITLEHHVNHENLLLNYCSYIDHSICVWLGQVEEDYIYKAIVEMDFDDSIADMVYVLEKIKNANKKAGYKCKLNPQIINNIKNNIKEFKAELKSHYFKANEKQQINTVFKNLITKLK